MAIPDYQTLMLPLLRIAGDGREHSMREAVEHLAGQFHLTDEERRELLPSGQQPTFDNRAHWARTYLKAARLLDSPRRGYFKITPRGVDVLGRRSDRIDVDFLNQFEEFLEFRSRRGTRTKPQAARQESSPQPAGEDAETPEEVVEAAYQDIREGLANELLQQVKDCSPAFFERLVVDLLVKMGYGGTRKDAGQAIGGSGDGGIDGIIKGRPARARHRLRSGQALGSAGRSARDSGVRRRTPGPEGSKGRIHHYVFLQPRRRGIHERHRHQDHSH